MGFPGISLPQTSHFIPKPLTSIHPLIVCLAMTDAENDLNLVRAVADYQFGRGIGERLFPEGVKLVYSKRTGRVRHIYLEGRLLATLRPTDGLLSLTLDGAKRLMEANGRRRYWVKVSREASPYVARGRSVFAKHVVDV
ncbi:MAG TPA: hypothetical protein ENG27_01135, partial [Candidatus Bathyarchaeota archaeon]|nr:hypothetical protein [Candidatus Bathyarchaeota archaeon]